MRLFVGDDWPGDHHDVELMNERGRVLARAWLPDLLLLIDLLSSLLA